VMKGYGPLQERNYFLSPKMMTQFLTGRKDGQSLEALGHAFYCEMKLTTTVQKLSKSSRSDQGGGAVAPSPPKYATGLHCSQLASTVVTKNDLPPEKQSHKS